MLILTQNPHKYGSEKSILTILRADTFFDLIIENSLGCKFVTTTPEETQKIRQQFSSKENFDIELKNKKI